MVLYYASIDSKALKAIMKENESQKHNTYAILQPQFEPQRVVGPRGNLNLPTYGFLIPSY